MSCPFCDNPNEPSWISCKCPGSDSARTNGFKAAYWQHSFGPGSQHWRDNCQPQPRPFDSQTTAQITPKASPPLSKRDAPTRDIGDCGPEASASSTDSKSAFSPRNQAILRFSEGIASTNPDLAGWINRAASAFLSGEPIPKRRPPKVAGKATKAARGDGG